MKFNTKNHIVFELLQFILTTFETKYEHNSKSVNKVCNTYREFLQHPCVTSVNFFIDEYWDPFATTRDTRFGKVNEQQRDKYNCLRIKIIKCVKTLTCKYLWFLHYLYWSNILLWSMDTFALGKSYEVSTTTHHN